jgi:hypothetical protein
MDTKYKIIALLSGIFIVAGFSHLVIHVHFTKETEHLTYQWIALILCGQLLLALYSYLNNLYISCITSAFIIIGVLYISYVKFIYEKNNNISDDLKTKNIL